MHTPWGDLQLFVAIAEAGSLSGAARALGITQPTVSRKLADLEATLGEPLFVRSVSGVSLTPFAARLAAPARRMKECAAEVSALAEGEPAGPSGVVRITAPPGVAHDFLCPLATHLREVLPEVRLEVVATVNYVDLARREADLALRMEALSRRAAPRDLVSLATREYPVAAYATRAYLATLKKPYRFEDVGWIGWAPPLEHVPPNPQLKARIPGFRPVFASDDYLVQVRAAEAGVGAIVLGRFRSRFALPTSLVEMPLSFGNLTSKTHLIAGRAALAIPRVRAVAEVIARELAGVPLRAGAGLRRRSLRGG